MIVCIFVFIVGCFAIQPSPDDFRGYGGYEGSSLRDGGSFKQFNRGPYRGTGSEDIASDPSTLYDWEEKVTRAGKWPEFIAKIQKTGEKLKEKKVMLDWEEDALKLAAWVNKIDKDESKNNEEEPEPQNNRQIVNVLGMRSRDKPNPHYGMEAYWSKDEDEANTEKPPAPAARTMPAIPRSMTGKEMFKLAMKKLKKMEQNEQNPEENTSESEEEEEESEERNVPKPPQSANVSRRQEMNPRWQPATPTPQKNPEISPNRVSPNGMYDDMPPNGMPPNGMPPNGIPPNGIPPNGMPSNGMPPNRMSPYGNPQNSMPPNDNPAYYDIQPNRMPQNGMPPNGMSPYYGMPSNSMPPNGMSPDNSADYYNMQSKGITRNEMQPNENREYYENKPNRPMGPLNMRVPLNQMPPRNQQPALTNYQDYEYGPPPNSMPPNEMPANGISQNSMPPNRMPPNGMPPNGMPPNGIPPSGMPPNKMPPNGMPPNGMLQNGMTPNGMPLNDMLRNNLPPNGMPQNGITTPYGMPPGEMPQSNANNWIEQPSASYNADGTVTATPPTSPSPSPKSTRKRKKKVRKSKKQVPESLRRPKEATPKPEADLLKDLPQVDDFGSPIRWVKFNSKDTSDGLARVTDPDTGTNRQYEILGTVFVPIVDLNPERLGFTTEPSKTYIFSTEKNILRTVLKNMDNMTTADDRDWLAVETIIGGREFEVNCEADNCPARCNGVACETRCEGDTCSAGCVGPACIASCKGEGCLSMCIGEKCSARCDGLSCDTKCRGKGCDAPCRSFSCSSTVNGARQPAAGVWENWYGQPDTGRNQYNREQAEYYQHEAQYTD